MLANTPKPSAMPKTGCRQQHAQQFGFFSDRGKSLRRSAIRVEVQFLAGITEHPHASHPLHASAVHVRPHPQSREQID